MHISIAQALGIWSELEAAFYGENKYGGDTAEIYFYRLMNYRPGYHNIRIDSDGIFGDDYRQDVDRANTALHDLLVMFKERHEGIRIEVNGRELGDWVRRERNTHRCHVQIIRPVEEIGPPNFLLQPKKPMPCGNLQYEIAEALEKRGLDRLTYVSAPSGIYFHE